MLCCFGSSDRPQKAKEEFNKIQLELADLSTKFSNNVLDATKAFSLTITDKAEVEGLPSSALGLAAQSAKVRFACAPPGTSLDLCRVLLVFSECTRTFWGQHLIYRVRCVSDGAHSA